MLHHYAQAHSFRCLMHHPQRDEQPYLPSTLLAPAADYDYSMGRHFERIHQHHAKRCTVGTEKLRSREDSRHWREMNNNVGTGMIAMIDEFRRTINNLDVLRAMCYRSFQPPSCTHKHLHNDDTADMGMQLWPCVLLRRSDNNDP
jgi:hypothetical protein